MISKVLIIIGLFGFALAVPVEHYGPPKHEKKDPKPYAFSYGVKNDYTGTIFGQDEESDGNAVHGSYTVQLPDGRKQTVNYKADHYNGFIADVSYYGEAQYPPKIDHEPFTVKPKYHHQPSHDHYAKEEPIEFISDVPVYSTDNHEY